MPEKQKAESPSSSGDENYPARCVPNRHKYKSEICKYWENGQCPYAQKCIFAHGVEELRKLRKHKRLYKTKACETWTSQYYCPYGSKCQFEHSHPSSDVSLWAHCVSLQSHSPLPSRRLTVFRLLAQEG